MTLADKLWLAGALVTAAAVLVIAAAADFAKWRRQSRCDHQRHYENRACQAICRDCGKDLGFIGCQRKISPRGGL